MSNDRKPRPDSVFKTLPKARQDAIGEYSLDHSLAETVAWLRADGLKTSSSALGNFLSGWRLEQRLSRNASKVKQIQERMREEGYSESEVDRAGQVFFTEMAMDDEDPAQWKFIQGLKLKAKELEFDREKFQFDATKAALAKLPELKAIISNSSLSEDEKLTQARLALFGSTPQ
jgi:hypothetical protein